MVQQTVVSFLVWFSRGWGDLPWVVQCERRGSDWHCQIEGLNEDPRIWRSVKPKPAEFDVGSGWACRAVGMLAVYGVVQWFTGGCFYWVASARCKM